MKNNKLMLGESIRKKRKELNLTQSQLAEKLNITNKAVSKWENDEAYPDISLLPQLAKIFNITIDELLCGECNSDLDSNKTQSINENTEPKPHLSKKDKIRLIFYIIGVVVVSILAFINLMSGFLALDSNSVEEAFGNTEDQMFIIIFSGISTLIFALFDLLLIKKILVLSEIEHQSMCIHCSEMGYRHFSTLTKDERKQLTHEFYQEKNIYFAKMYLIFLLIFITSIILSIFDIIIIGSILYYISVLSMFIINILRMKKFNKFLLCKNIVTGKLRK